jgi:hypothetical protein
MTIGYLSMKQTETRFESVDCFGARFTVDVSNLPIQFYIGPNGIGYLTLQI